MNKHAYWAWAIKNSIVILCWTALAMVFDKWWIALFALLFVSDLKNPVQHYFRTCDTCGEHSPFAETPEAALKKAKEAGWTHYESTNTDYCPKCQLQKETLINETIHRP